MSYHTGPATAAAGENITLVCPPRDTDVPVLLGLSATADTDDESVYVCSVAGILETNEFTAAGDTTTLMYDVGLLGVELVEYDVVVVTTRHGSFEALVVDSVSGNTITWKSAPSVGLLKRSLAYVFLNPVEEGLGKFPSVSTTTTQPAIRVAAGETVVVEATVVAGRDIALPGVSANVRSEGCPMVLIMSNTSGASIDWAKFTWAPREDDLGIRVDQDSAAKFVDGGPVQEG